MREAGLQAGPQVGELPNPLSPGSSRRPRSGRSCGKAWRSYGYAGYRGPRGQKRPPSSALHPRWPPVGVRARDPVEREELNPELSVPLCPLLPRGPERHTPPPGLAEWVGGLPAWPSVDPLLWEGQERRWWSWQQNSQALVAGLDQGKLDQEAAIRDLPAPKSWAPDCRQVPTPCSQPRARGLSSSCTPPRASARSSCTPPWIHGLFILPCSPPTDADLGLGILLPSPTSLYFLVPFLFIGQGEG